MIRRTFAALACLLALPASAQTETPVRYRLDVIYSWSAATHPDRFPADAHIARLFGVPHAKRYVLFRDGNTASSGVILMAENGRDTVLQAEWTEAARKDRVGVPFEAPDLAVLPGAVSVEFETTADRPFVSFVSMIAPSPDWFTGLASVDLQEGDVWRDSITLPLWAWDAGSDSGETYASENAEVQPRQSVRLLTAPQFFGEEGLQAVGQAVLTRVE